MNNSRPLYLIQYQSPLSPMTLSFVPPGTVPTLSYSEPGPLRRFTKSRVSRSKGVATNCTVNGGLAAGSDVAVGGIGAAVGGSGVIVGGTGISVGGSGVAVGGTVVRVGWTSVSVGGIAESVGDAGAATSDLGTEDHCKFWSTDFVIKPIAITSRIKIVETIRNTKIRRRKEMKRINTHRPTPRQVKTLKVHSIGSIS